MFYAQLILAKKGLLGKVWMAAHWDKKLNRQIIFQTDVTKSAESIANPKEEMPLRVSGSLLLGVVRIFSHKVKYLSTDCEMALTKMKMAFRPGVDPSQEEIDEEWEDEEQEDQPHLPNLRQPRQHHHRRRTTGRESFQRLTLDVLPPMAAEWLDAAAQTMARKQDITMEEHDNVAASHMEEKGLGGEGGHHHHANEAEAWEAFDPSKLGIEEDDEGDDDDDVGVHQQQRGVKRPGRYEEEETNHIHRGGDEEEEENSGGEGGHPMDSYACNDDDGMIMDDDDYQEEKPEVGRFENGSAAANGDAAELEADDKHKKAREDSLDIHQSFDNRLSVNGRPSVAESSIHMDMSRSKDDEAMLLDDDEPILSLADDGEMSPGHVSNSDLKRDSVLSGTPTMKRKSLEKRGKKRPLPVDHSLVISGMQMKEQLADYTPLVQARIRPRDRMAAQKKFRRMLIPVEVRLAEHTLSGSLCPDLEGLYALVMKPLPEFEVPVAKRKGVGAMQRLAAANKKAQEEAAAKQRQEAEGKEEHKMNGGAVGEEEAVDREEGGGSGGRDGMDHDDGIIMDDDDYDFGGGDGHYPDDREDEKEEDDGREGQEDDDDEERGGEEEEDGFIRTNAADGGDGDAARSSSTTKWHPNTVKMCRLLRARMAGSKKSVSFGAITYKNRRTKAANKFFEILQLKTWDFIQVHQDVAYDEIQVTAAARFHDAIPK